MEIVTWCNLCNAAPSEGQLMIEDPVTKEPISLDACSKCVYSLDWEGGNVKKVDNHV